MITDHLSRMEKPTEEERGTKIAEISLISNFFKYQFKHHGMLIL